MMKGIMMESAQDICGMTKGPHRHNEEVAEAVSEKEDKVRKVEENTKEATMEYKKSRKMQRGLSVQQRKRNRRNVQMT